MQSLSVSYARQGGSEAHTLRTNGPLGVLTIDTAGIDPELRGGTAKQLLGCSVLYCYCAALDKALTTRGAVYTALDATATLETGVDELKRARIRTITLDVVVTMAEEHEEAFERVVKVMRNGCLVSASLEGGMEVVCNLSMRS